MDPQSNDPPCVQDPLFTDPPDRLPARPARRRSTPNPDYAPAPIQAYPDAPAALFTRDEARRWRTLITPTADEVGPAGEPLFSPASNTEEAENAFLRTRFAAHMHGLADGWRFALGVLVLGNIASFGGDPPTLKRLRAAAKIPPAPQDLLNAWRLSDQTRARMAAAAGDTSGGVALEMGQLSRDLLASLLARDVWYGLYRWYRDPKGLFRTSFEHKGCSFEARIKKRGAGSFALVVDESFASVHWQNENRVEDPENLSKVKKILIPNFSAQMLKKEERRRRR